MRRSYLSMGILSVLGLMSCQETATHETKVTDSNTPLHLLAPEYTTPYKMWTAAEIKQHLDRIFVYLDEETPTRVRDTASGKEITDYMQLNEHSLLENGDFRLASYEWGVTYTGMLEAAVATADSKYREYVAKRFNFLSEVAPHFLRLHKEHNVVDRQIRQVILPGSLDDAGAMCAAMIKFSRIASDADYGHMIDNYMDFIENKEHRLADGTFARMRPQANSLWLDDMYMGIPALAQMGEYTGEKRYFDEALRQIKQFTQRMFVPDKGLYMHGWIESADSHPAFHWARANGWALLTLTEVLDVLPQDHPERADILSIYQAHVKGIASYQSGTGFWHQLLDRSDSYLETSATAIYVYCIARGINNGWLDAISYGPVAQLGWSAVSTQINEHGQVEGTCVGTGMAFDPAYYYHRPVNAYAAHGYGPTLLAGAEMITLIKKFYPKINDSAIQYYKKDPQTDAAIFGVDGQTY
ncbi:glycoside hydrolase family 88/105 protein [Sphingobacterium gobiense]|uniref:Family 88 glycosyl hydrolase n=1 Tax=Sphingobacterium gobiense TaxID=1382456 RepID=A0A2S9JM81_9SPHI|nr:glycoside hydrolase family 88 protein [Sphingobacterium gobiense]PRD54216.1 family 88 glycosyl hydrolase [Sphingobacterium gobiense]